MYKYNFGIKSTNLNISVSCYRVVIDWVSKKQTLPAQLQSQTQTGSCCSSVEKMASPEPPGLLSVDVFYDPSSSVRTLLVRLVAFLTLPLSLVSPSLLLTFSCVPFLADICRHIPASSRPWPLYTRSPFSCGGIYNGLTPFSHISQC